MLEEKEDYAKDLLMHSRYLSPQRKLASGVFYLIGAVLSNILNVSAFAQLAIARRML